MIGYPQLTQAGRLGNQLWEIASTYGIACGQLDDPVFPKWDYQPFFSCPDEWFREFPGPRGYEVVYQEATRFVPYMDPRARAYLQDYNLFKGVADRVHKFFQPSELACQTLDSIWETSLPTDEPVASVHIRRGDNVTHPQGYHPLRSWDYYRSALALINSNHVAVFSDDPEWCEKNFENETGIKPVLVYRGVDRPREYVDRVKYETAPVLDWIDLQLMARCDEHIISNSTYAWWGAFLSDDPSPIYPSNWFGWRIRDWTDASLMFPESWREVEDPTQGGV